MAFQAIPQTVYTASIAVAANRLVKLNGAGLVVLNTATPADLPVGVTYSASTAALLVPVCGIEFGIQSIMADAVVISINDPLYAAANGMVTNVAGGRLIGIAKTAAPAGSVVVDVIPMACILTAAALAAATAQSLTYTLGTAASFTTTYSPALGVIYVCLSTFTNSVSDTLNVNFQTLYYAAQKLQIDVADIRAKLITTKAVQ